MKAWSTAALIIVCACKATFAAPLPELKNCQINGNTITVNQPSNQNVVRCAITISQKKFAIVDLQREMVDIRPGNTDQNIDVSVINNKRLLVYGKANGTTQVVINSKDNQFISLLDITVQPDLADLKKKLFEAMPDLKKPPYELSLQFFEGQILIKGTVETIQQKELIGKLALGYIESNREKQQRKGLNNQQGNRDSEQKGSNNNSTTIIYDARKPKGDENYDARLLTNLIIVRRETDNILLENNNA